MSELERIKRVIEVGQLQWFSATDVKFLLNEVDRLKTELIKISDMHVPKSAENAFTQDMQTIAMNAAGLV